MEIIEMTIVPILTFVIGFILKWIADLPIQRKIEELKVEQRRREQAKVVAELLAYWPIASLDNKEDVKSLNRLAMEATLVLPNGLARELNNMLAKHKDSPEPKELLVLLKQYMWEPHAHKEQNAKALTAGEITHWDWEKEKEKNG